jgi:hypothetical protein
MNRGRAADRRRPNPTLTQRQRELLALYASAPPGEKLVRFCRRAGIHRDTWHGWRTTNADFAAELERIRQERLQVSLEPLHDAVPQLVESLVKLASGGSIQALRTAGDWLGLTRRATQNVQLAVDARGAPVPEPEDGIEELLQKRARLLSIIQRRGGHGEIKLPSVEELGADEPGNAASPVGARTPTPPA